MKGGLMLRRATTAAAAALTMLSLACERRDTPRAPGGLPRTADVRQIELQPGAVIPTESMAFPYDDDPHAIAEGKRLFAWYNCSGCHFAGGGGIGPPLMDDDWIYGREPQNILATIMEGRPNGMPSYRGKLPQEHALKIVAYVRSLDRDTQSKPAMQEDVTEDTAKKRTPGTAEAEKEAERGESGGDSH